MWSVKILSGLFIDKNVFFRNLHIPHCYYLSIFVLIFTANPYISILKFTKGIEDFNSRTLAAFVVDENTFIKETIRKDLDTILDDMVKKHHKKELDELLSQIKTDTEKNIELALEQAKNSEANIGSRRLLTEEVLNQLHIPINKISDEQLKAIEDIIKLSPLLDSGISQRGKN